MVTNVFPHIFEELIEEDITWLIKNTPEEGSLELDHVIQVLRNSVKEYRERGYMEAMSRRL